MVGFAILLFIILVIPSLISLTITSREYDDYCQQRAFIKLFGDEWKLFYNYLTPSERTEVIKIASTACRSMTREEFRQFHQNLIRKLRIKIDERRQRDVQEVSCKLKHL